MTKNKALLGNIYRWLLQNGINSPVMLLPVVPYYRTSLLYQGRVSEIEPQELKTRTARYVHMSYLGAHSGVRFSGGLIFQFYYSLAPFFNIMPYLPTYSYKVLLCCPRPLIRTSKSLDTALRPVQFADMHRAPRAMVARPEPDNVSINTPRDPNTLSNYNNWTTTHTAVDLKIDFEKKLLHGSVKLSLKSLTDAETNEIVLDTRYNYVFVWFIAFYSTICSPL